MKTTTTILEILQAKAARSGYNAFIADDGTFRLADDGTSIISQIAQYSDFIKDISSYEIFGGFVFKDKNVDIFVKRLFLSRFLNREIKFQTIDLFRNKLVFLLAENEQWFTNVYNKFEKMFDGENNSNSSDDEHSLNEGRGANSTLPQDNTQLDLSSDIVEYADDTQYNRGKTDTTKNSASTSTSASTGVIQALDNVYLKKFKEFESALFLGVW